MKKTLRLAISTALLVALSVPMVSSAYAGGPSNFQKDVSDAQTKTDVAIIVSAIASGIGTGTLASNKGQKFDGKTLVKGTLSTPMGVQSIPSTLKVYIISDKGDFRYCVSGKSLSGKVWRNDSSNNTIKTGKACTSVK